ncbi:MAG: helix-turn-helix domain-containing protein [Butyricimonas virosa]|nr:helix-turn-helix domain-containing protein [Butyricimonas virosa]
MIQEKNMVVQLTTAELKKIISEAIKEERPDNTSNTLKEVFGLDEFCEMTGYSKQTAYKLVHERKVPFYKPEHGGRKILFKRKEVEEWLTATRVATLDEFCDEMECSL